MIDGPPARQQPVRVVKVGGSLLDWRPLPTTLVRWLAAQGSARNILIAGGGALADLIRRADATYDLGEQAAHALCMDVLGVTARLLAATLAGKATLATWADVQAQRSSGRLPDCQVLDARSFLFDIEAAAPLTSLPHTWDVTSDSIAAWVACGLAADELVLLKSRDPPGNPAVTSPPHALAAVGYVDRYFPTAVALFAGRVQMVNLRRFAPD
jgi:5-(aminomethyl)-3-furanmethanol phosphate kinase